MVNTHHLLMSDISFKKFMPTIFCMKVAVPGAYSHKVLEVIYALFAQHVDTTFVHIGHLEYNSFSDRCSHLMYNPNTETDFTPLRLRDLHFQSQTVLVLLIFLESTKHCEQESGKPHTPQQPYAEERSSTGP